MNEATAAAATAQKMIDNPINAWMATLPILFVCMVVAVLIFAFVLWKKTSTDSADREKRLSSIIDNTLIKQTEVLTAINTTLTGINQNLCDVKERVSDIENVVGIKKGA
jgi:cyanate permease